MKFDTGKIRALAKKDYETAWVEGGNLIEKEGTFYSVQKKQRPHPLYDLIERARWALLELGFTEVVVPILVDKREVQTQYGPESAVILDRVFFLAGLERPDIGISQKNLQQLKKVAPGFKDVRKLQAIFRQYKKGKIDSDNLVETMVSELGLSEEQATAVLTLFPKFRELKPVPMDLTLRSHTSAGWFGVLKELQKKEPLPLQLFSIGPKFRREQKLDAHHLYESWTASIVVMTERMSLEDGERLVKEVLAKLGFNEIKMERKKATSKYYAPQTESEIFVKHPRTGDFVEVGDAGFYSPVALSNYDIPYPVFNLGVGLERMLMIETGEEDIRAVVFPHVYKQAEFSDAELVKLVKIDRRPRTEVGWKIMDRIVKEAEQHADEPSPCEFTAFEGELLGMRAKVKVVEPESNTKLIGPAGFNEVYIFDGNMVGLPPKGWKDDEFLAEVRAKGSATNIRFIDAFAALAASEIENAAEKGERQVQVRARNVKLPSDINLVIDDVGQRYITANNKRIDIRGPVFTTVVAEIS
ncbi:MAG: O-phosphoserine--tRNA ligase [Candidatus Hadarchaeota archaeon]